MFAIANLYKNHYECRACKNSTISQVTATWFVVVILLLFSVVGSYTICVQAAVPRVDDDVHHAQACTEGGLMSDNTSPSGNAAIVYPLTHFSLNSLWC